MELEINSQIGKYQIIIEKDILNKVSKYIKNDHKILLISDSGVPSKYIETIKNQFPSCYVYIFPQGEKSKNIQTYQEIIKFMIENNFTRKDIIIALGGGVVGDLSGFIASTYMRGIKFYNIPTTLLSQVDSSIGGKTAIDFDHIKNIIGTFYQPNMVLIDPNTLNTLSPRQFNAGLVEAIKMACCFSKDLFNLIKTCSLEEHIEEIIYKSLEIKKYVVTKDVLESSLRKVLNFGHTIGHGIESYYEGKLLHGECVSLGMLYFSSDSVKEELKTIYKKLNLNIKVDYDKNQLIEIIKHDKKANNQTLDCIYCPKIGEYEIRQLSIEEIYKLL